MRERPNIYFWCPHAYAYMSTYVFACPHTHISMNAQTFPYKTDWHSDVFLAERQMQRRCPYLSPGHQEDKAIPLARITKENTPYIIRCCGSLLFQIKQLHLKTQELCLIIVFSPASSSVATKQAGSYGHCLLPRAREREVLSLWGSLQFWHMVEKSPSPSQANHTLRNPTWSLAVLQHETNDFNQWNGKFQTLLPPGLLLVWCTCGFGVYKPYPFLPGFRL